MPSRSESRSKSTNTKTERKYFKQILKAIDNMQLTILQKLESSENKVHQDYICKKTNLNVLRAYSQTISSTLFRTNNYQSIDKKRSQKLFSSKTEFKSPNQLSKIQIPKQENSIMNEIDMHITPKRQKTLRKDKTDSPFRSKLDSPFCLGVFERSETLKKMRRSPELLKQDENERGQREVSIWQRWKQSKFLQKIKPSRHLFSQQPTIQINSSSIQRYYQMKQNNLELEQTAVKLQQEFQHCLISKRKAPRLEQIHLRNKMSELSMRIARIREQQIRII